ncbi:MAG: PTS sugar transporter subunit IIA [Thermoguttaceae bacterium]|nr:PTS sugar transporter subunit IIA [Thermoguttaceae bacterium]MDW8078555.1 PTS sugar transporter subunit IIA [Thermoguttaceae bacterium]
MQEEFDIRGLAEYLHLRPDQVLKLAERRVLPGRKIGGQWRFSRAEVHQWLEERIGLADESELLNWEATFSRPISGTETDELRILDLLPLEAIAVPLDARSREGVLREMVALAARTGWLWDPESMLEAVRARESLCSTALDIGVALLHPRRPMPAILEKPFLALGVTTSGIPFGGNRSGLTDIFFLICSVDDRQHLRTLARLSRLLTQEGFLAGLRQISDAKAAREWIADCEQKMLES